MRNLVFVSLLFLSCKENKISNKVTNILKIQLSENLPFKQIKLKKFDPVYGMNTPFDYQVSKANKFYEFKLHISEPTLLALTDEHDVGAGYIFLEPNENLTAEIFWEGSHLKKKVIEG